MDQFNKLLDEYKNQYLQFLATGNAEFKTAYEKALDAINNAISSKREGVDAERKAMQHFAGSYAQSNAELSDTVDTAKGLVQDAQDIHDGYETSKIRYKTWTEVPNIPKAPVIDVSVGYSILLRFGIFLVLLPILLFLGYIVPSSAIAAAGNPYPSGSTLLFR
jgi:hypothetical protein